MLNWFRRREINRLLCERAKYEAYCEGYDGQANHVFRWERGQLAEVNERLRQLGWEDEEKTVMRVGLPQNYLRDMLKKSAKILDGEQDNG